MSATHVTGQLPRFEQWDRRFLDMAKLVASWSKDPGTQVGAVITKKDRTVISVGYNGFPRGMDDSLLLSEHCECHARFGFPQVGSPGPCICKEKRREEKLSRTIHAEMNALLTTKQDVANCTIYIYPFLCCDRCFVQLVQAGVTRFVSPTWDPVVYSRWKESFHRVKLYAEEMSRYTGTRIEIREYKYE